MSDRCDNSLPTQPRTGCPAIYRWTGRSSEIVGDCPPRPSATESPSAIPTDTAQGEFVARHFCQRYAGAAQTSVKRNVARAAKTGVGAERERATAGNRRRGWAAVDETAAATDAGAVECESDVTDESDSVEIHDAPRADGQWRIAIQTIHVGEPQR